MKVVYVSGPYRADTEYGVHRNIQEAERVALKVWEMGAVCICPHKNTAYFGGALPGRVWLQGGLELLRRSDAVVMIKGWPTSTLWGGARAERDLAKDLSKPVFGADDLDQLEAWLKE